MLNGLSEVARFIGFIVMLYQSKVDFDDEFWNLTDVLDWECTNDLLSYQLNLIDYYQIYVKLQLSIRNLLNFDITYICCNIFQHDN